MGTMDDDLELCFCIRLSVFEWSGAIKDQEGVGDHLQDGESRRAVVECFDKS
jgi:hypothetical protein